MHNFHVYADFFEDGEAGFVVELFDKKGDLITREENFESLAAARRRAIDMLLENTGDEARPNV